MISHSEISKARTLFLSRGIMNRDVLRDEIVYSWVRSKLHNISVEILDHNSEQGRIDISKLDVQTSKIISKIRSLSNDSCLIVICDPTGKVIFKSQSSLNEIINVNCYSENYIGTNAIGVSLNTNECSSVYGFEHYNKILTNFVSSCLVHEQPNKEQPLFIGMISPHRFEVLHFKTLEYLKQQVNLDKQVYNETVEVEEQIVEEKIEEYSDTKPCKVFTLSVIEKKTIKEALEYYHWNHKKAAAALGIGRSTLYRKIKEYDIEE